jgi:hypothetical protein
MPLLMVLVALYLLIAITDGNVMVLAWQLLVWAWGVNPVVVALIKLAFILGIGAAVMFDRVWRFRGLRGRRVARLPVPAPLPLPLPTPGAA